MYTPEDEDIVEAPWWSGPAMMLLLVCIVAAIATIGNISMTGPAQTATAAAPLETP